MSRRVIVAVIGVLVVVALIVLVVVLASGDDASAPSASAPSAGDCAAAGQVVSAANDKFEEIVASEAPLDASYFAAILTEQRTITYVMDAQPDCFSLAERAASEGLLEGIKVLAAAADRAGATPGDGGADDLIVITVPPDVELPPFGGAGGGDGGGG